MAKNNFTLALLLSLSTPAAAADWFSPLSSDDQARLGVYYVAHAIDWGQTLNIANDPRYWEINPLLPDHPTRAQVNRYFALTGLLYYAAVRALPPTGRRWFQYVTITAQAGMVARNYSIGLRADF